MTRGKIKVLALVCATLALTLFAGCGADINVYEQQDEDNWYFLIEFELEDKLVNALEESATFSDTHNRAWSVELWLEDYFGILGELNGFEYRYDGITEPVGTTKKVYSFTVNVSKTDSREEFRESLALNGETNVKTNLFMRTINVVRDDRFNIWVREYEEVAARFEQGNPSPTDGASVMGIFLFGSTVYSGDESYVELPGFSDAFPAVDFSSYGKTGLHNFWCASRKMNVTYDDKIYIVDEYGIADRNYVYYVFDKEAGDGATSVEYDYYRADPTGWYLVALAAGGATVGLIILGVKLSRKKKKPAKPDTKDLFPYDPFDENGGGSGGSVNPFDGY